MTNDRQVRGPDGEGNAERCRDVPPPAARRRARPRALRRAVRRAHARHEVLGDARPDGDHRAPRGHLAGRRPARHVDLPARDTSPRSCRASAATSTRGALQYGPTEGLRDRRGRIAAVMAAEGADVDPERPPGHDRRPAGHRPGLQDAHRPRRRDRRRGADLPGRGPDVLRLPGRRRADRDGRRRHARSTSSRRRSTGSSARAGGRSSSTRSRTSRTRAA